ncbi:protein-tyrosine phosphatase family protein, partial [Pseudomonas aeruginosa]
MTDHAELRRLAEEVIRIERSEDEPIIVHCQAGMSRSAAVAKFLADKRGYTLNLSKPC